MPGSSTLTTSAPHSPSVAAACGPWTSRPASTTLMPSSAPTSDSLQHGLVLRGARRHRRCRVLVAYQQPGERGDEDEHRTDEERGVEAVQRTVGRVRRRAADEDGAE